MNNILVDTNILIDYSKGKSKLLQKLLEKQRIGDCVLYINPVIISEYFTDNKMENEDVFQKALGFISFFNISQITKKEGLTAGKLLRQNRVNFIADALIAASCLENDFQLVTRNSKHFKTVSNLKLFEI